MKKICLFVLVFTFLFPSTITFGDEEIVDTPAGVSTSAFLFDDCADLSKVYASSEGIYPSVIEAENQYAFDEDFTVFMRQTATAEWITYQIPEQKFLTFYTYFRQGEEISHFVFQASEDGNTWDSIQPVIQIREVDSWKWIPVTYSCKNIGENYQYIKIIFQNIDGTEWSPCISSVDAAYREIEGIGFADCVGTPYENATERLKNLNLINGYNAYEFAPDNQITRAEFTKMISSLLNITDLSVTSQEIHYFRDVSDSHWAAPYIYALYGLGIVNGDENQRFHPEDQITLQEAVKIIVAALGYDIQSQESGGYPNGYIQIANQLGILQNISISFTDTITRGIAALLMDYALDVPYVYQTQYGTHNIYTYDGTTVLEKMHGIYTNEGIVSDVGIRSIYADNHVADNLIAIDDLLYQKPSFDMKDFLGVQTQIYYKTENGQASTPQILYAKFDHVDTIVISHQDILEYQDGKLVYQNAAGQEITKTLNNEVRVIYNGRYYSRVGMMDELPLSCGTVTIIQNGNDRSKDVLRIEDYETYLSQTQSRLADGIHDRYAGIQKVNLEESVEILLYNNGEEIDYDSAFTITPDSVVQIAQSSDLLCTEIQITNILFTAQISSIQQPDKFYIEEKEYISSPYYQKNHSENISLGTYKIYLDKDMQIVDLVDASGVYQYGYLLGVSSSSPFENDVSLRIAAETGIEVYSCNNRTRYNDAKVDFQSVKNLTPQLIRYKLQSDGSILSFYTAKELSGTISEDVFALNYSAESSKYYGENLKVFSSVYQLDQNTKVFFIPSDLTKTEDIKIRTCDSLYTDYSYHVALYDVDRNYIAGAAVIFEDNSTKRQVGSYDPVMLIEEAVTTQDADGNMTLKLCGYVAGAYTELNFPYEGAEDLTNTWLSGISPRNTKNGNPAFYRGEVIQYYAENNLCESFRLLLTHDMRDNDAFYEKNLGDYGAISSERYYSEMYAAYAPVYQKFSDKMFLSIDGGVTKRTITFTDAAVYLYDQERDKIYPSSVADIASGDRVFVRLYYTGTREIIIIK